MEKEELEKKAKELCELGICISRAEARRIVLQGAFERVKRKGKRM